MIAHLYICNRSFRWNGTDQLTDFQRKMVEFQRMMECVCQYADDNKLYIFADSFLKTEVLKNVTMSDLFDYEKAVKLVGREAYVILMGIMKHYNSTKATIWNLKEYLSLEDENNCHAVIAFTPLKGLAQHQQVITTEQGWYNFRRYYLGKYPQTPSYFLSESEKYFKTLKIHPDNKVNLRDVIHSHPLSIVHCLSVLNDNFSDDFLNSGKDMKEYLPQFAMVHKIDGASLEGNKDKKFYFLFHEEDGDMTAYCEAHLKMYHDDNGNDNKHCRIYFKKPILGEKYIYVGYIGEHL